MTALVTGTSGFVGAAVARALGAAGHSVRAMVRQGSDRRNLAGMEVEVCEADLTDPASLTKAVKGCDAVFHVAADYRLWVRDPQRMFLTNVDGTRALLLAAAEAGARRIVYTSSVATLGIRDGGSADEETVSAFEDMIGPYKRSKFLAEVEVQRLVATRGVPAVIVNPSTPVGPGDVKPTPTGRMILEAAAGRMPAYVDTGLNIVHVGDVAEGHLLAFERGKIGERYILGGENMHLGDILAEIASLTGGKPPRFRVPHAMVMPIAVTAEAWCRCFGGEPFATVDGVRMARKRMFFSSSKAQQHLGYTARPARRALHDAVRWFVEQGYLSGDRLPVAESFGERYGASSDPI
jgi:dihydroflavonol-4-reductase